MSSSSRDRLLHPTPGGKIAEAEEFGIDVTMLAENLRYSPAERIRRNDQAANSMLLFRKAVKKAKEQVPPRAK
jgi:hypothetical protein